MRGTRGQFGHDACRAIRRRVKVGVVFHLPSARGTKRMDRRQFLGTGATGLALSTLSGYHAWAAADMPLRVGLIGCGWYGKCDLLRLIQVAPINVVSLCDVDKNML